MKPNTEDRITSEAAQRILDRDAINRVEKVSKGGLLPESERKRLRKIIRQGQAKKPAPKVKKEQKVTAKPTQFEGTFEQKRRRRKVFELRLRRYSIRDMAEELDADHKTIMRDLIAIDEALSQQLNPIHATEIINETLANYETVMLIALDSLPDTEGNERAGLLNAITRTSEAKTALLQDAGILPRAGKKMELTGKDGVPLPANNLIIAPVVKVVMEETPETRQLAATFHARER